MISKRTKIVSGLAACGVLFALAACSGDDEPAAGSSSGGSGGTSSSSGAVDTDANASSSSSGGGSSGGGSSSGGTACGSLEPGCYKSTSTITADGGTFCVAPPESYFRVTPPPEDAGPVDDAGVPPNDCEDVGSDPAACISKISCETAGMTIVTELDYSSSTGTTTTVTMTDDAGVCSYTIVSEKTDDANCADGGAQ